MENSFEARNNSNGKFSNILIKCFNGKPIEFQSFFYSIRVAINEKDSLKNVMKFNYLRTFRRWPALASISGLSLTSASYNQAVEILEKRYGNKQLFIISHNDQLLSVAPITSTKDVKKIRENYDKIETNVGNLCSLEIDISHYDPVLISFVMSKLPEDIKLQISWPMPLSREWDVDEF